MKAVKAKQQPRHLTEKQKETLLGVLSAVPGTTVEMTYLSDRETSDFAKEIMDVLLKSGWKIDKLTSVGIYPPLHTAWQSISLRNRNMESLPKP